MHVYETEHNIFMISSGQHGQHCKYIILVKLFTLMRLWYLNWLLNYETLNYLEEIQNDKINAKNKNCFCKIFLKLLTFHIEFCFRVVLIILVYCLKSHISSLNSVQLGDTQRR